VAGAEMPAAGRSAEEAARPVEVPASATGASVSTAAAATDVVEAPPEPSRTRKRGFSSLR
jgi:hypothetical protein